MTKDEVKMQTLQAIRAAIQTGQMTLLTSGGVVLKQKEHKRLDKTR